MHVLGGSECGIWHWGDYLSEEIAVTRREERKRGNRCLTASVECSGCGGFETASLGLMVWHSPIYSIKLILAFSKT